MKKIGRALSRLWKDEEGQALMEYGLIIALIAVGVIAVLALIGPKLKDAYNDINTKLDEAKPPAT